MPSQGTGNNTGAIGAAQPIRGLCSPSLCRVAKHCRVGTAKNKGLNLPRLKCSNTEPEQLHGILVPGWNTYRVGLGAMVVSELLSKSPSVPGESPLAGKASILLRSQLLRHQLLPPASATLSLPASGAHDSSQHRKPRFVSKQFAATETGERMGCMKMGALQPVVTEEISLVFWS